MTEPSLPVWIPNRLLTAAQTADLLHVSVRHVRRLIDSGALPAVHIGRNIRIRPESVAALAYGDTKNSEKT